MDEFPVVWEDPADAEFSWEWDDMHFPAPLAPLAGDYVRFALTSGFTYRFARTSLALRARCRIINGYAYFSFEYLTEDKPALYAQAKIARQAQSRIVQEYWEKKVLPALFATYGWLQTATVERMALGELAEIWDELWQRQLPYLWGLHFMTNAGSYQALNDLADLYESIIDGAAPGDALRLVAGQPNDLHRVQQDLHALAERARTLPAVAAAIVDDADLALDRIAALAGGAEFLASLERFVGAHGHLGQPFDDLAYPSWQEDLALLLREVRKRLIHPQEDPERRRARQAAEADALTSRMRERLAGEPERAAEFDRTLAHARTVGPLTEGHNYWLDRMLQAHTHRFIRRVGRRLADAGVIEEYRDAFFLHAAEVSACLRLPVDLGALVDERKAALHRWARVRPPKHLGTAPGPPLVQGRFDAPAAVQSDGTWIRGVGASAGSRRGPVRIVRSPDDFGRVQPGDVLVCPSSNPSWVPLFGIIGALVTDTGGVLSHAAVVAREFGVPAVVGTGEATLRLREGQQVEVNGATGEVTIIS
ncbi:MAG TPA: PEP-utilizing enzyme [bacterium]|nr:PEP-utilizing enzyme [bacterium]